MEAAMNKGNARPSAKLTQVKVSVDPGIAAAFKAACAASNISMAAELARFMSGYANGLLKHKVAPDYSTRRRRRTAVKAIIKLLGQMKDCEVRVRDRTPENLQGSVGFEATEEAIDSLETAIEALAEVWMVP